MKWLTRMFTLPKRYNSLSDIARNPLGALTSAASWAVPLAMGLPGGIRSLPKLFTNPALLSQWSSGNLLRGLGGLSLSKLTSKSALPWLAAGIGFMQLQQANRATESLMRQIGQTGNIYYDLFASNAPARKALLARQLSALHSLPTVDAVEAQARAAVEDALRRLEASEQASGVRTASAERRRAQTLADYGRAVAQLRSEYPLRQLSLLMGLPAPGVSYLAPYTAILGNLYENQALQVGNLAQALAMALPYLLNYGRAV